MNDVTPICKDSLPEDIRTFVSLYPGYIELYKTSLGYKALLKLHNYKGSFVTFGKTPECSIRELMDNVEEDLRKECIRIMEKRKNEAQLRS